MGSSSSKTDLKIFFDVLGDAQSSALVMDYDGTLAPFRVDRDAASPYTGVQDLISRIMDAGRTRVVLVSGRPCQSVLELLDIHPAPEIWGVHGLERMRPNGATELEKIDQVQLERMHQAEEWLQAQGYSEFAEPKHGTIAVHWRGLSRHEAENIQRDVLTAWQPLINDGELSLLEFDGGLELRVAGHNKGNAVLTVLSELPKGTPFAYLGDDNTDEDAFAVLQETSALTVLVRPQLRETLARIWIRPPRELLEFLTEWLDRTES